MPISKAILGQTLTTEIGSTGSYAASNTHRIEERFGRNKIKVGFTNKDVPNKQGFMTSPTMIY